MRKIVFASAAALALIGCSKPTVDFSGPTADWPAVGQNNSGQRYSALTQINRNNVSRLKPAWTYHLKDFSSGGETHGATALQVTPLVVNQSMYLCTPFNRVISLDPESGEENWVHDPEVDLTGVYAPACRGVSYWEGQPAEQCQKRIYLGTLDARLIALDADTGKPCEDFGDTGAVDLTQGLGRPHYRRVLPDLAAAGYG